MDVKDKDCKILSVGRSHQVNGAAAFLQVHLEVMQEEAVWRGEFSFVGSHYRQQLGIHSTTHSVGQRVQMSLQDRERLCHIYRALCAVMSANNQVISVQLLVGLSAIGLTR